MTTVNVPRATYRLQLHHGFPFSAAEKIIPYLKNLGVSHLYLSPIAQARRGSLHGYDTVNHNQVNAELGGEEAFLRFKDHAHENGLGIIVDVVPNHMHITGPENFYWMDVLENGPASPYAKYFDINWEPSKKELTNKVLLPVLGDLYGKVLEAGQLRLIFENGGFYLIYYESKFPLDPRSWNMILNSVLRNLADRYDVQNSQRMELESIINSLSYLPAETEIAWERIQERQREKEVLKKRLAQLVESNSFVAESLQKELDEINGQKGRPRSFDRLEELLDKQAYRLCDWKVAADEINYRRFFDINELAAIRIEDENVFREIHRSVFDWVKQDIVAGLRIDHVDGLLDPQRYLSLLNGGSAFVVVEKILSPGEKLDENWSVAGTTGYEFLNLMNGLFVNSGNADALERFYRKFTRKFHSFNEVMITSKKFIMLISMASELRMLALMLDRISEQHRWSRDFTLESIRFALREVVACFPVYRSYIRESGAPVREEDREAIVNAIHEAKRRNPATPESIFDFIEDVLTLRHPEGLSEEQKKERFDFVLRLQQFTGPVMAKGLEDTSFYRYVPLLSLNEVGGRPDHFGVNRRAFHQAMAERRERWPHSFSASTTHDTKRSEDVRARINVLSEIPTGWSKAVRYWHKLNLPHKILGNHELEVPDNNEEYLLYQTLLGSWPLHDRDRGDYLERIQEFMLKAVREAKIHTSWLKPNEVYEKAVIDFVRKILDSRAAPVFLRDFEKFNASILRAGLYNGLSQALLKMMSPGVPDFYQGTESWNFSLVDPDNRRAVDYEQLQSELASLRDNSFGELLRKVEDGRVKLFVTQRALDLRKRRALLFKGGAYVPLVVEGERGKNIIAFARQQDNEAAMIVAGRFFMDFGEKDLNWSKTMVLLPPLMKGWRWKNTLTGQTFKSGNRLDLKDALKTHPCALFEREL